MKHLHKDGHHVQRKEIYSTSINEDEEMFVSSVLPFSQLRNGNCLKN